MKQESITSESIDSAQDVVPVNVAMVGLGKMGLSHLAILGGLAGYNIKAACDSSPLMSGTFTHITGTKLFSRYEDLLDEPDLAAIVLATPTAAHEGMIRQAIDRGLHTFCEKPLTLSASASLELAELAEASRLVTQVGYHNRFIATFAEAKRLVHSGALGRVTSASAQAYGPVVTKPTKGTWRSKPNEGGGALFDYAAHAINLLNWYFGPAIGCDGAVLRSSFSRQVEDEVHALLSFADRLVAHLSVNWSDSSCRKMTTEVTIWGTHGKLRVDRQELQVCLTGKGRIPEGYSSGWNVRNITELTRNVGFYLRGEEYSSQLEHFAECIRARSASNEHDFRSAAETDLTISLIREAYERGEQASSFPRLTEERSRRPSFIRRLMGID